MRAGSSHAGPNGPRLNTDLCAWALEHFLGVSEAQPELMSLDDDRLCRFTGRYETIASSATIVVRDGRLVVTIESNPDVLATLGEDHEDPPPIPLAMVAGEGYHYIVVEGPAKGMRGYFATDTDGHVVGMHLGGRLAERVDTPA